MESGEALAWHEISCLFYMADSSITPGNDTGAASDNYHEVELESIDDAAAFFGVVKQRLLQVNHWHIFAGKGSAVFQLTDEKGNEVDRPAQLGDHFKIDVPGPGNKTGKGFDWVQVEAIIQHNDADEDILSLRVRPTDSPQTGNEDIAHFFSEEASSTFSVIRRQNRIIAKVEGRNEKPNVKVDSFTDKVRNIVIATGAVLGLNKPQWKAW